VTSREGHAELTNGIAHWNQPLTLVGAGAAAPTLGEGDPNGSYWNTPTRTSAGLYVVQTKEVFIAPVEYFVEVDEVTPTGIWVVEKTSPLAVASTKSSGSYWQFTFALFRCATANIGAPVFAATDLTAPSTGVPTAYARLRVRFRNSGVKP
jgi:hypothetical protein